MRNHPRPCFNPIVEAPALGQRLDRTTSRMSPAAFVELVMHLARRDVASRDRFTILGSAWPLVRQLAQLAVLVFTFSKVLPLHVPDYGAFVFTGLIGWTWFITGISGAA